MGADPAPIRRGPTPHGGARREDGGAQRGGAGPAAAGVVAPVRGKGLGRAPRGLILTAGTRAAREEAWGRLTGSTRGVRGGRAPHRQHADRPPACFCRTHTGVKLSRLEDWTLKDIQCDRARDIAILIPKSDHSAPGTDAFGTAPGPVMAPGPCAALPTPGQRNGEKRDRIRTELLAPLPRDASHI